MTIQEAIKILQFQGAPEEGPTISAFLEAKQLGIEALKRFQEGRPKCFISAVLLLPGETKE